MGQCLGLLIRDPKCQLVFDLILKKKPNGQKHNWLDNTLLTDYWPGDEGCPQLNSTCNWNSLSYIYSDKSKYGCIMICYNFAICKK